MSTWLARLKNQNPPGTGATKPTKPTQDTPRGGFVGFVAHPQGHIQKFDGAVANPETPAANAPAIDPDRWCWPHGRAMNTAEIDTFTARLARFTDKGMSLSDAEALADKLVVRDCEGDDRQLCLECVHLSGVGPTSWRCGNWQAAGIAIRPHDTQLPAELVVQLQRCGGFTPHLTPTPQGNDDDHNCH